MKEIQAYKLTSVGSFQSFGIEQVKKSTKNKAKKWEFSNDLSCNLSKQSRKFQRTELKW